MEHLVLCPHRYNIKLLVCLAWNDNQSTEIVLMLFVSLKISVHQQLKSFTTKESRSTGEVFILQVTEAFCLLSGKLALGLASIFLFAHMNGNHFVFNVEIASAAIKVSTSPKEVKEIGSKPL